MKNNNNYIILNYIVLAGVPHWQVYYRTGETRKLAIFHVNSLMNKIESVKEMNGRLANLADPKINSGDVKEMNEDIARIQYLVLWDFLHMIDPKGYDERELGDPYGDKIEIRTAHEKGDPRVALFRDVHQMEIEV